MAVSLVNGKSYDYSQIRAIILGVPVVGITNISYTQEQEKTNNFGTGNLPVSRGEGAIDSTGSLDISMNDVEALRDAAPDGSFLKIPAFDIVIVFENSQRVITHVLKNVQFTNDGMEAAQGDTDINRSFDIVIGDINYRP